MNKTKHFQKRQTQRVIKDKIVEFVLEYGTALHDGKVRLDRKSIKSVLGELDSYRRLLLDAERKGGVVVVVGDGDTLVTTYALGA